MQFAVTAIRFFLFALSTLGVWELLRRRTGLCALRGFDDYLNKEDAGLYFIPSLTIAIETTFLFIGGLLNVLREMAFLLYLTGLALFFYYAIKEKSLRFLKNYVRLGYAFLLVVCAVLLICVNGQKFFQFDNFSHWALVVKQMLATNRYPNFWDFSIRFQEYPLGSSSYIYFFALLVSKGESMWMFAQDYIIIAAILPLFAFVKNNRVFSFIFILAVTNFILVFNISYFDLYVDTLLPAVSMCALMYLLLYSSDIKARRLEAYLSIFYFVQILQIKNSGIFFVLIASLWLIFGIRGKETFPDRVAIAVAPYISFVLWHRHCKYVFVYAEASRHAMTPEALKNGLMSHPPEMIKELCRLMAEYTLADVPSRCVIICMLAFVILGFVFVKKHKHFFIKLLIFNFVMYAFYQFGLLLMYIFSMEGEYALELPSVDRYSKTILIAIMYSMAAFGLIIISELKFKRVWHCAAGAILLAGVMFSANPSLLPMPNVVSLAISQKERTDTEARTHIEMLIEKYSLANYENGVILSDYSQYNYFIAQYLLESKYIGYFINITDEELETMNVQYVLNFDPENPAIQAWLEENYPEQLENEVIFLNAAD